MSVNPRSSSFIFLISWLIYFLQFSLCVAQKQCRLDNISSFTCGKNADCAQTSGNDGVCKCSQSFYLDGGECVPVPPESSSSTNNENDLARGSSAALWIVIPCLVIILTGTAFFLVKRLKLIEKLYQFRVRRYNTVFVTSLQDDDAPIT